jgi:hypothetical protein
MDIKFIRLKNGDDIIARCRGGGKDSDAEDSPHFVVSYPLKVVYFTNPRTGNIGLSFMHWIFPKIAEVPHFKIYCDDILTVADASDYIIKSYSRIISQLNEVEEQLTEERAAEEYADALASEADDVSADDYDFFSDLNAGKRTRH